LTLPADIEPLVSSLLLVLADYKVALGYESLQRGHLLVVMKNKLFDDESLKMGYFNKTMN